MPAAIPARPDAEQRLREACAQLRQRVREGDERALEEILAQFPELAGDPDQALELVYAEVALREQLGRQLPPAAWLDRFPQWRERLHKLLEVHQALRADGAGRTVDTSLSAAGQTPHTAASGTELAGLPKPRGYEVLEELGRGGMGVVFKARQVGLNRLVALKMILAGEFASDAERSRFRAEAEATARLDHPHIVRVHEVGEQEGQLFLAMEYVAGGTLAEVFASGPQSADEAARLVELLARAVEHAHQQGIIHRDLKPGNILLQGKASPKIVDFGLAKRFSNATTAGHGAATATGALLGTPSYMAPEQAAGGAVPVGPAVDVYALGAILYEALTGRPPFRGQTALDTLDQERSHEPVPVRRLQPRVPRDLETICLKCL
ncbi:MAG TPA: serine/threonine-protein kinase, partial [Pirellulaceae bacterium]|nr:serine/threonine-protein kinase [Pirellulaceae bacterium]